MRSDLRRLFTSVIAGGGGDGAVNTLLSKFAGGGDKVALVQSTVGGTQTQLDVFLQTIKSGYYWRQIFGPTVVSIGGNEQYLGISEIRELCAGYNHLSTPAITESAAWTKSAATIQPGGYNLLTNVTGRYAEVQIPSGATICGATGVAGATNAGMVLVAIDGDNTLAEQLPTAQQLVDGGTLSASALVGGGGTLNPTDRIWDNYNLTNTYSNVAGKTFVFQLFSTALSAGSAHTVRLTVTGYKRAASTGTYALFSTIFGNGVLSTAMTNAFHVWRLIEVSQNTTPKPVWEISYNTTPTGATNPEWMGHLGSMKTKTANVVKVDGSPVTPTVLTYYTGDTVQFLTNSSLRHSEIGGGATEIGVLDITFTFHKNTGLTIAHTLTWGASYGGTTQGYPGMMMLNKSIFDRCRALDTPATDCDANDGSQVATTHTGLMLAWDENGSQGAMMYIPDLAGTCDNWLYSGDYFYMQDSLTPLAWNKMYAQRFDAGHAFSGGTVWTSEIRYMIQWFAGGAEVELVP